MAIDWVHGHVELAHGGGARRMHELIEELFYPAFDNPILSRGEDQAVLPSPLNGRVAVTTDSHVVTPLFFPGGDIGALAVHGTINDLAVGGAQPHYLSVALILEEGLALADLRRIIESLAAAARAARVEIVTGDTKVVERGKGDGIYIQTTGVGTVPTGVELSAQAIRPGDRLLLSGTLGDHGAAILSARSGVGFTSPIRSDSAALHDLVAVMLEAAPEIRCMRDPTRGGLAATLHELARQSGTAMQIYESALPLQPEVVSACELLGFDPLYLANEGKLVAVCPAEATERLLKAMQQHPLGAQAAIVGEVAAEPPGFVEMETVFGSWRTVDWLAGEQLPRIC
ncbi:hydrogenase expression/formation protein HypE [Halorhodospira abdelmalekii]|uniref:hydrogenase expression/formation protein HypE n=1 Tax=Halorhodospira abdelmalekii TaxID=421629 RepID=UPI0019038756|nr:hydrogenase expression/formation protein HypE [Halorhodospira abdelmalekii]MBK1735998.1 hydrogenase expression/formation protein HypE [Halorhodospira abdelmalekii]